MLEEDQVQFQGFLLATSLLGLAAIDCGSRPTSILWRCPYRE